MTVKVTLAIDIIDGSGPYPHASLMKVISGELVLAPGMHVEDDAWREPKVPSALYASLDRQEMLVQFPAITLKSREACEAAEEHHQQAGWTRAASAPR